VNVEKLVLETENFQEFKKKSGLSTNEALDTLKEKLKELKGEKK